MKKIIVFMIGIFVITNTFSEENVPKKPKETPKSADQSKEKICNDFLPKGYVVFEKILGDLNKDGLEDCVLIVKGTKKSSITKGQNENKLVDRNRRGLVVLLNKKDSYELVLKNYECFSSENEDGGVYMPPELGVYVENGNLIIHYFHGRYGYWKYTFRFKNSDFELIGYENSSSNGPVVSRELSINFLTNKKIEKVNANENSESDGNEVFKETVTKIEKNKLIKLSEVTDFDELDFSN